MPLELRKQRDGRLRDTWYGRYEISGRRYVVSLGVKVKGTPPESFSLMEKGDTDFECSRVAAQAKLDQVVEEARSRRDSAHLVERLYEIKTGERVRSVKLGELVEEWAKIPRRRKLRERYAKQWKAVLRRFVAFVREQNPKVEEIAHVPRPVAQAFMEAEAARGVGPKTWNDTLKLLRNAFKYLLPAGAVNPFFSMVTKEADTVFRQPFTPKELKAIVEAAKDDPFIRPIIVAGMCTAMRRGDCCLLRWKDVDLGRGFITVKTAKTGQTVSIPIFGMLRDELVKRLKGPSGRPQGGQPQGGVENEDGGREVPEGASAQLSPLAVERAAGGERGTYPVTVACRGEERVFPEQAAMYLENPDGITWRVKKVLAVALGGVRSAECGVRSVKLPEVSEAEVRQRGQEFIAKLPVSEKKQRMLAVFDAYMDRKKSGEVAAAGGVSKGSVSGYLNEIEGGIGCRVVRGRAEGGSVTAAIRGDRSLLRVKREDSERRASVRDFHSFRVTWVTLALTAGVPLELVQKVTGHKTTDIVLKHYFQPGREDFRQTLQSAMPKLLTNGHKTPKEEMREMLNKVKPKALRERLLKVWAKL